MIDTTKIADLYDVLTTAITQKLDALYDAEKVDDETYAKLLTQSFDDALKLSVSVIQQQQQIEKDLEVKDAQIAQTNQQVLNMQAEKLRIDAQVAQLEQEVLNMVKQGSLIDAQAQVQVQQKAILETEKLRVAAQTSQITAETLNIPKQGELLTAQVEVQVQQKAKLVDELLTAAKQREKLAQEVDNLAMQELQTVEQTKQITQQTLNLNAQNLQITAQTKLVNQQAANALTENDTMLKQQCKLQAEYDVLMESKLKTASETILLTQKTATEKAQITSLGVDDNSVIGKQKALYAAQTDGFKRDAEQKAAKLMVDSWNVRRTTDEGTVADATNMLNDAAVGRAVAKLLSGVGA